MLSTLLGKRPASDPSPVTKKLAKISPTTKLSKTDLMPCKAEQNKQWLREQVESSLFAEVWPLWNCLLESPEFHKNPAQVLEQWQYAIDDPAHRRVMELLVQLDVCVPPPYLNFWYTMRDLIVEAARQDLPTSYDYEKMKITILPVVFPWDARHTREKTGSALVSCRNGTCLSGECSTKDSCTNNHRIRVAMPSTTTYWVDFEQCFDRWTLVFYTYIVKERKGMYVFQASYDVPSKDNPIVAEWQDLPRFLDFPAAFHNTVWQPTITDKNVTPLEVTQQFYHFVEEKENMGNYTWNDTKKGLSLVPQQQGNSFLLSSFTPHIKEYIKENDPLLCHRPFLRSWFLTQFYIKKTPVVQVEERSGPPINFIQWIYHFVIETKKIDARGFANWNVTNDPSRFTVQCVIRDHPCHYPHVQLSVADSTQKIGVRCGTCKKKVCKDEPIPHNFLPNWSMGEWKRWYRSISLAEDAVILSPPPNEEMDILPADIVAFFQRYDNVCIATKNAVAKLSELDLPQRTSMLQNQLPRDQPFRLLYIPRMGQFGFESMLDKGELLGISESKDIIEATPQMALDMSSKLDPRREAEAKAFGQSCNINKCVFLPNNGYYLVRLDYKNADSAGKKSHTERFTFSTAGEQITMIYQAYAYIAAVKVGALRE